MTEQRFRTRAVPAFEEIWQAWPRKAHQLNARALWDRVVTRMPEEGARVIAAAALEQAAVYARWPEPMRERVPLLTTWLKTWRWTADGPVQVAE